MVSYSAQWSSFIGKGWQNCSDKQKWKKTFNTTFLQLGYERKMQYVLSKKRLFLLKNTKNYKELAIFSFFKFLKTHKSSFKNGLILVFHLDTSKSIQKIQIWFNIKKSPSRFCHPSRSLCSGVWSWHQHRIALLRFISKVKSTDYMQPNRLESVAKRQYKMDVQ